MRVLLLIDTNAFAGTERHMLDLAQGLIDLGCLPQIGCPATSSLGEHAAVIGFPVIPISDFAHTVLRLARLLRSGAIDIIHAHNGRSKLAAVAAAWLARRGGVVATQHFLEPAHVTRKGPSRLLFHFTHRWVDRRVDQFIAISEAARDNMIARHDAPSERITVVPNGIPPPDSAALQDPAQLRASLNLLHTSADEAASLAADQLSTFNFQLSTDFNFQLIFCAARLEPEKDIATLIDAMRSVAAAHPKAICLVAGMGSEQQRLQEQIDRTGLRDSVRLLGFRKDVLSLMSAADIFVLPSLAEPFGLVLLEAMALGRPAIATDAGGPREIVVDGETGLLVPPADPPALAQAIVRLLEDAELRARFGMNGLRRYEAHFTAERMAKETIEVYRKTVKS